MEYQIWFTPQLNDLSPISAGECDQNTRIVRNSLFHHYSVHCILSGRCTFYNQHGTYDLRAGQIFLIKRGDLISFTPDSSCPFHLRWINFGGELSHHFSKLPTIMDAPEGFLDSFCDLLDKKHRVECLLSAQLLELYAHLFAETEPDDGQKHVRSACNYIRQNYMYPITVQRIAELLDLHRGYLSRIFKKATGYTVREYILRIRLTNARQHLYRGYTVEETARLCGFGSVSGFCRLFKKHDDDGMTPLQKQKLVSSKDLRITMSTHKQSHPSENPTDGKSHLI